MATVAPMFNDLNLSDDEDDVPLAPPTGPAGLLLCAAGRFLTSSPINFQSMKNTLADLWHPLGGVNISDLSGGRYLFRFFFEADLISALDGSPWTFNRHPLLLSRLNPDDDPTSVPLNTIDMWVQAHHVPFDFFDAYTAQQLGEFIGTFIRYDSQLFESGFSEYMRFRVRFDVSNPLKRRKKLIDHKGQIQILKFKYERVPTFCFLCGHLGHNDSFCPLRLQFPDQDLPLRWDASLRAATRRNIPPPSPWLRSADGNPISSPAPSASSFTGFQSSSRPQSSGFPSSSHSHDFSRNLRDACHVSSRSATGPTTQVNPASNASLPTGQVDLNMPAVQHPSTAAFPTAQGNLIPSSPASTSIRAQPLNIGPAFSLGFSSHVQHVQSPHVTHARPLGSLVQRTISLYQADPSLDRVEGNKCARADSSTSSMVSTPTDSLDASNLSSSVSSAEWARRSS